MKKKLETMIAEEFEHYDYFDKTMLKKRTRPTVLSPIWHHGGYLLGAVTSLLGEKYVKNRKGYGLQLARLIDGREAHLRNVLFPCRFVFST